jgi:hypothetical protein
MNSISRNPSSVLIMINWNLSKLNMILLPCFGVGSDSSTSSMWDGELVCKLHND